MKHQENKQLELATVAADSSLWTASLTPAWEGDLVYRELAEIPVQSHDLLNELARSVSELADKQARLRFMMREIRGQMKI